MTLTPERKARTRERLFAANIASQDDRLTALRLKRKHAHEQGLSATVDAFDVEIGNLERFIERQKQRANGEGE
jgi:hypothetical protein